MHPAQKLYTTRWTPAAKHAGATGRRMVRLLLAAVAMLAACNDGNGGGTPTEPQRPAVASVEITPDSQLLEVGQTITLAAVPRSSTGVRLVDRAVAWTVEDPAVATVSSSGLVTTLAAGTTDVVASSEGKRGVARIEVHAPAPLPQPAPTISMLVPNQITAGWGASFTLAVAGEGFVSTSRILWNGVPRETVYLSPNSLHTTLSPSEVAVAGAFVVTVETPAPGGGSASTTFTVNAIPVASVQVTSPMGAAWTWVGERLSLQATLRDHAGNELPGRTVTWRSESPTVASVSPAGVVRGTSPGQTSVAATADSVTTRAHVRTYAAPQFDLMYDVGSGPTRRIMIWSPGSGYAADQLQVAIPASDPSSSPDGTRIAFTGVHTDGNVDVYVVNRNGSGLVRLTSTTGIDDQPAWSPDGTSIAFRSTRSGYSDIWVMDANGGNYRQLTPDAGNGGGRIPESSFSSPAWSPDGTSLAYAANLTGGDSDIWAMRADGSAKRQLTSGAAYQDLAPVWAPSGETITFRREWSGHPVSMMMSLLAADGTVLIPINPLGDGRTPAISPDGRWLVYSGPETTGAALMATVTDGSDFSRSLVAKTASGGMNPAWGRRQEPAPALAR